MHLVSRWFQTTWFAPNPTANIVFRPTTRTAQYTSISRDSRNTGINGKEKWRASPREFWSLTIYNRSYMAKQKGRANESQGEGEETHPSTSSSTVLEPYDLNTAVAIDTIFMTTQFAVCRTNLLSKHFLREFKIIT